MFILRTVLFLIFQISSLYHDLLPETIEASAVVDVGVGSIAFEAIGKSADFASLVEVSVFGPNEKKKFAGTASFNGSKKALLKGLALGTYYWKIQPLSTNKLKITPKKGKVELVADSTEQIVVSLN